MGPRFVTLLLLGEFLGNYTPTSAQPGATKAQAAKPTPRKITEKLAAIQAVGVGKNIYDWLTYSVDAKPSAVAQMALEASEMTLELGAGILEVSLSPSPRQARMQLRRMGHAGSMLRLPSLRSGKTKLLRLLARMSTSSVIMLWAV